MHSKIALIGLATSFASTAFAQELTVGELNTGAIIEDQDVLLSPNFSAMSVVGLSDKLELGSFLLGNAGGFINLGARYGVIQNDDSMLAVHGHVAYELPWETDAGEEAGGVPWFWGASQYSVAQGDDWITFEVGAGGFLGEDGFVVGGSNVGVYYLMVNGDKAWEFELWTDPYALSQGVEVVDAVGVSARWLMAREIFRFGLGLEVMGTNAFVANSFFGDIVGNTDYSLPVIAAPSLYLAFRF